MTHGPPLTVDEFIIVSAVLTKALGRGIITAEQVDVYTDEVIRNAHAVSGNLRKAVISARTCAALSHMDLLESPCIDK
jgi:hypothetical protein